ncbi:MAG: 4-hydroxy-3-methylbut-2-enyl diphosphate reductase [Actinomycetota bacterium]|jgi:4-hydroxy-3-methylbut-2-enyl diphosphate reductase|nr:4-hydroxy-3-methylbut-2-enyl diphosphate reductase [Actinomycetota bacterium]
MRVEVARHAGVCYGVERALRLAQEASEQGVEVHTLGPLIHNPQAVAALKDKGVDVASSLDEVDDGILVVRSHGVDPAIIEEAVKRGLDVVDATCPFVSAAHTCAEELANGGYSVIIVGEEDHPEVEGILAHAGRSALIVQSAVDLPAKLPARKIGVVVQTTQSLSRLEEVVSALLPRVSELRVCNTICSATAKRQLSAEELALTVDAVVVVGGHNSGNTARLAEICRAVNPRVHHVETADEVDPAWFDGLESVGVTAGASTPDAQMAGVVEAIKGMG